MALSINTTKSYGGLLQPNPKMSGLVNIPAQQPSWQNTLSDVMKSFNLSPSAQQVPAGSQTKLPSLKSISTPDGSKVDFHKPETTGSSSSTSSAPLTGYAKTDPNRIVNEITGQTALQAATGQQAEQPLTGNATTPSGAVVDSKTGQVLSAPSQTPTFGGLVGGLASFSPLLNPQYQDAISKYNKIAQNIADIRGQGEAAKAGYLTGGLTLPVSAGRSQILGQTEAAQEAALGAQQQAALESANTALTGTGQQLTAQQAAAGLAQPQLGSYGQTFYSPLTQTTAGGNLTPETQAQTYANEVASGARTYDDAVSAMGLYGNAGKQFLDQAIRTINPNFNFSQAQALGTTQGTVAPQLQQAQLAIQNLQNTFNTIPSWQKTGIPALNALTGLLSEVGIGTGTQKDKENALSEARTQVANALGVMTNTTPTAWTATVQGWFPDNATPSQLSAGVQQFNQLAQNRQNIFGTPGSVQPFTGGQTTPSTSGSIYDF